MYDIITQAVGIIGLICSLLSFQQKKRSNIMVLQMTASILFSAQLFLVGAITGGCLDLISFVRTLIFSSNKKWASHKVWLFLFIAIMILTGILTWQNSLSLLAISGSILSTIALWMKSEKKIRLISLTVGPCWLIYNLINRAYSGALNELMAMASIIIGIIRCDIMKKSPSEKG